MGTEDSHFCTRVQLQAGAQAGAGTSQAEQLGAQSQPHGMRGAKTLRKKPLKGAHGIAQGVHPTATSEQVPQVGAGAAHGAQAGAGAQTVHGTGAAHGAQAGAGAQTLHGVHSPQGPQAGLLNSSRKKPLKGVQTCLTQGPQVSHVSQTGAGAPQAQS